MIKLTFTLFLFGPSFLFDYSGIKIPSESFSNLLSNRKMQSLLVGNDHGENRLKDKSDESVQTEQKTERILVEMGCQVEPECTIPINVCSGDDLSSVLVSESVFMIGSSEVPVPVHGSVIVSTEVSVHRNGYSICPSSQKKTHCAIVIIASYSTL